MFHLANLSRRAGRLPGLLPWLAALLLAAVIVGCGGGGTDTAGNGVGVGGTGAAAGPVSGYGSIIVNSVRFDFSGDTFTTEDASDSSDDRIYASDDALPDDGTADRPIGIGTMVSITSGSIRRVGDDDLASATRITLISSIRGPLEAKTGTSLTVLGQQVDVDAGTWYTPGRDLAALVPNTDFVVVYADLVAGRYKATRVEYRAAVLSYKLRGNLSNLDTANNTFRMGSVTVNYRNARGASSVQQAAQLNQQVRVRLVKTPVAGAYIALSVVPIASASSLSNGQQTRLSGVATDVNAAESTCVINGVTVNYSTATLLGGQPDDDSRVDVQGTMQDSVLVATQVITKSDAEVEQERSKIKLIGAISQLSGTASGTFSLKGITVNYNGTTTIEGTLANGRNVDVDGTRQGNDQTVITATRIRVR
jgi:hypothetical protein